MNELKTEIQKWLASTFIWWAFNLIPDDNEFKIRLAVFLKNNIDEL